MAVIRGGLTIEGAEHRVSSFLLGSPALGDDDAVLADTAMGPAGSVVTAGITNPAVVRNLTVKGNEAGIVGDVVIEGTNHGDEPITETFALNGDALITGNKAFKTVTEINLPAEDAGTNRVRVGTGAKLALPVKLTRNTVLKAFLNGVLEGTPPTVAFSSSALESNTVALASALAGTPVIVDLYQTKSGI